MSYRTLESGQDALRKFRDRSLVVVGILTFAMILYQRKSESPNALELADKRDHYTRTIKNLPDQLARDVIKHYHVNDGTKLDCSGCDETPAYLQKFIKNHPELYYGLIAILILVWFYLFWQTRAVVDNCKSFLFPRLYFQNKFQELE